jgi:hypothetical protein
MIDSTFPCLREIIDMNQFLIFKNATEQFTVIPLEAVSRLELELILEADGQLAEAHDVPVEALYPRGTSFHYNALAISSPNHSGLVALMAKG